MYLPVLSSETSEYRALTEAAASAGAELVTLTRYGVIARESGAYAVCISPRSAGETDENDSSIVLYLSYSGVNILLGGDISAAREELLLSEYALDHALFDKGEYKVRLEETDILKVSHHGSAGSSSNEWLSLLSPETAVISCGKGNFYSHPAFGAVLRLTEAGADIYRTDELGNVMISVADGAYSVRTHYTE